MLDTPNFVARDGDPQRVGDGALCRRGVLIGATLFWRPGTRTRLLVVLGGVIVEVLPAERFAAVAANAQVTAVVASIANPTVEPQLQ